MQDNEAQLLSERQADLVQQAAQQASSLPAGKPKETETKKATPKELQQATVSATP